MAILSSYLVLFIGFYLATYKKPLPKGKKGEKARGRATSALVEMKDEKVPTVAEAKRRFSGSGLDVGDGTSSGRSSTPGSSRVTRSRKT